MVESWVKFLTKTPENERLLAQEDAILQVTERICKLMKEQGVSKAQLARKMGIRVANLNYILDGEAHMSIRTVSDLFFHLNHVFEIR
jgi:ribosome-binding protein aMBF1 (putative translation factor)